MPPKKTKTKKNIKPKPVTNPSAINSRRKAAVKQKNVNAEKASWSYKEKFDPEMNETVIESPYGRIFQLMPTQEKFVTDFRHSFVGYGGGWANGKTYALCRKALLVAELCPGIPILLGQVTEKQLKRSLIPEFARALCGDRASPDDMEKHPAVKAWLRGDLQLKFINGSTIDFVALGTESGGSAQVEKLQSTTYGFVGIDQADTMPKDVFIYLTGRNRKKNYLKDGGRFRNVCAITYNPEAKTHWIYRYFVSKIDCKNTADAYHTYELDSIEGGLVDKDLLRIWQDLPQDATDRFVYGKWGSFENQVYKSWDDNIHVIKPFRIPDGWDKYLVMDYGYSAPSCFLGFAVSRRCIETPDVPENICFGFYEHYQARWTIRQHIDYLNGTFFQECTPNYYLADPSIWHVKEGGESIGDEYSKSGIYFEKANNDQWLGVERLLKMLQPTNDRYEPVIDLLTRMYGDVNFIPSGLRTGSGAPALFIFENRMPHTVEELPSQRYEKQRFHLARGNVLAENQRDHAADCVRYFSNQVYESAEFHESRGFTKAYRNLLKARKGDRKWRTF